jgi:hypothetical protein
MNTIQSWSYWCWRILMANILEQVTTQIREAHLADDKTKLDNLIVLKADIAHGLSQKQPVKAQKTVLGLVTSYKQTQALLRDSGAVQRYQDKIDLLESLLKPQSMMDTNALQQLLVDNDFASIRDWMGFLKDNYADQYDGKLASTLYNSR